MHIKSHRRYCTSVSYYLFFSFISEEKELQGSGYSFDCNEKGEVDKDKLSCIALANYQLCLSGKTERLVRVHYDFNRNDPNQEYVPVLCTGRWVEVKIAPPVIQEVKHSYCEPAIGECNGCGEEVILSGFTNTCDCGLDYNMSGQQLAPRSQWGEETGESPNDILRIR